MIVIAGVSIAFQLNNLKLNSDQKSLEKFYLESMLGDLRKDREKMSSNLESLKKDKSCLESYLQKMNQPDYPAADSLGVVLYNIISLETFTPNQNTYQMLVASNGLTAFNDREIRTQITEYYNRYTSIQRFEAVYTNVLFNVGQTFGPYSDFLEKKIFDPTLVTKPQTKNLLVISNSQLNDGVEAYMDALKDGEALIKIIENRLRR